jgi:hypothetical protein
MGFPAQPGLARRDLRGRGCGRHEFVHRLVPQRFTGEGGFKWPEQLVNGEMFWQVIRDNDSNAWGDFGRHFWELDRAYEPVRPHAVCFIIYKRANADLGLSPVLDYDDNGRLSI